MFNIGEAYISKCISLDSEGNGICKIDDFTFFTKDALPDETVEIIIDKLNKNYGFAHTSKILEQSPFRVNPICPYYSECGGCNMMHYDYSMHKSYKRDAVTNLIKRIGKIDTAINDTIVMDNPLNYRNNIQVSFAKENNKIVAGFYANKTHKVIDMDNCLISSSLSNDIISYLKYLFMKNNISIYNPKTKKGSIKQVMIRTNSNNECMIVFITNTEYLEHKDIIVKELVNKYPNIKSIMHNINIGDSPIHLGLKTKNLYGANYLLDEIDGINFQIDAHSFYQVNKNQMLKLYGKVFELLDLKATDNLIDAYSGIGTMSLLASKRCKHVYAIEVVSEAIKNANNNKAINNITNVDFILGKCEDKIKELMKNKTINALIVDPPRKGCEESFLESILGIEKIVYVSCNPSTLARDLNYLCNKGYVTKEITPVDMFPYTNHVESVCLLQKK